MRGTLSGPAASHLHCFQRALKVPPGSDPVRPISRYPSMTCGCRWPSIFLSRPVLLSRRGSQAGELRSDRNVLPTDNRSRKRGCEEQLQSEPFFPSPRTLCTPREKSPVVDLPRSPRAMHREPAEPRPVVSCFLGGAGHRSACALSPRQELNQFTTRLHALPLITYPC